MTGLLPLIMKQRKTDGKARCSKMRMKQEIAKRKARANDLDNIEAYLPEYERTLTETILLSTLQLTKEQCLRRYPSVHDSVRKNKD